jgi:hypothetical protein
MTDLQLGLLVIGAAVVAAVLVYNRLQERRVRRESQRSFASTHADVLAGEPPGRREPTFAPAAIPADARIDYVIEVHGVPVAELEARFGARALVLDSRVALQMVSRRGVVAESELIDFRSQVETLAASHGGTVSAPEMRTALEAAHALDRACAEVDIQVALHVLGVSDAALAGDRPFRTQKRDDGLTFLLDVPRAADPGQDYEAMVRSARQLGGRLVDDNGRALDERSLAAIGAEVEATRARLEGMGIEPGGPLALRLFS